MKSCYKAILLLIVLLFTKNLMFAQTSILIKGRIMDMVSSQGIEGGNVFLYNKDTLIINSLIEDDGTFSLTISKDITSCILILKNLRYEQKCIRVSFSDTDVDFGDIKLKPHVRTLEEVNITANKQPIVLRNYEDTLEADFTNQYFRKYVMVDKALELIPGISIVDSKFYFNGIEIQDIKVNGRTFVFDNNFLLYNLPSLAIKRVQVINEKDVIGKGHKRINIILKDSNRNAYIVDFTSAKGTKSSNWDALAASRTDSLFQVGIRAQSNNLNHFTGLWDIKMINRINNLYGINKIENLELTGVYQLSKKARLDFNYWVNNQTSIDERRNIIIDLTSLDQNQSQLNSSSSFIRKSHFLNLAVDRKLNSLTNISAKGSAEVFTNISENRSTYHFKNENKSDSAFYEVNRNLKAKRLELVLKLNRLASKSKRNLYSLEITGEINRGQNNNDSLNQVNAISVVENLRFQADNRINLVTRNKFTSYGFFNSDVRRFNSVKDNLTGSAQITTYYNTLGITYHRTGRGSVLINLAALNYSLKYNRSSRYNSFGVTSNVNFDFTIDDKNKIAVSVNNTNALPSINQITGIETSGLPQLVPILPNYGLRPEMVLNLNSKYNYGSLINLDFGGAIGLNKIENTIFYLNVPVVQYFNSKKTESLYLSVRLDNNLLDKKLSLGNTFKVNYSLSTFYSDKEFIPNPIVFFNYYLSLKYNMRKYFKINYLMEISKSKYLQGETSKIFTYSSTLNMSYDMNNTFNVLCDALIIQNTGFLQKNTFSKAVNLNMSQKILKNKNLTLFCEANNLFNDRTGQIMYSDPQRLQRLTVNSMGRYLLFGAKYKLNTYKQ